MSAFYLQVRQIDIFMDFRIVLSLEVHALFLGLYSVKVAQCDALQSWTMSSGHSHFDLLTNRGTFLLLYSVHGCLNMTPPTGYSKGKFCVVPY